MSDFFCSVLLKVTVFFSQSKLFIVQAKKQHWSTSLCHSLVPHTCVQL